MFVENVQRKKVIFYGLVVSMGITVLALMANGNNFLSGFFVKPLSIRYNDTNIFARNSRFDILVFNRPHWLSIDKVNNSLANECEFSNCRVTNNRSNLHSHSAIIYYTTAPMPLQPPILPSDRNPNQVWIFAWREAAIRHKLIKRWGIYLNKHWRDSVNWTMTYTHDADLFYGYGVIYKRIPPVKNYSAIFERKTKMAAWIVSNCHPPSQREKYVKKLQQSGVKVDIFGQCAGKRIDSDKVRNEIDKYKFYLSFENSLCKDYITEKFFKYLQYDVVLVVRGGGNYSSLLPNDSYINTADFGSVKDLAKHLLSVGYSEERYIKYLKNKDRFESDSVYHIEDKSYCQICKKLNNLGENRRTYTDLMNRVQNGTCFSPTDIK